VGIATSGGTLWDLAWPSIRDKSALGRSVDRAIASPRGSKAVLRGCPLRYHGDGIVQQ
jgi:hypothetical protein